MKIPGLYNGTDKTFFMYNWEQIRSEVPFPQVYTVPSALERTGDFSQSRTADGRPITIYDPLTDAPRERPVTSAIRFRAT